MKMQNVKVRQYCIVALLLLHSHIARADFDVIEPQNISKLIEKGAMLIDVRTVEEFNSGHIPGALNFPLSTIVGDNAILLNYANKPVILYCRSGYRANKAAKLLLDLDFTDVRHLDGDFLGWVDKGLPVEGKQ